MDSHHPKADTDRLYMPRKAGGRALIELQSAYNSTTADLCEYIKRGTDNYTSMIYDHQAIKAKKRWWNAISRLSPIRHQQNMA